MRKDAQRPVFSRLADDQCARRYRLEISQQPRSSRIRSDCLPAALNPLPVCRLLVESSEATAAHKASSKRSQGPQPELCLQNPNLFCVATLCHADSKEEVDPAKDGRLKGNKVSSIVQLKDSGSANGAFSGVFVFPFMTICLCAEGDFCFKLSVFELGESEVQLRAHIFTDKFKMYEARAPPRRTSNQQNGVAAARPASRESQPPARQVYSTPPVERILRKRRLSHSSTSESTDPSPPVRRRVSNSKGLAIGHAKRQPAFLLPPPPRRHFSHSRLQNSDLASYSLDLPPATIPPPPARRKSSLSHSLVAQFAHALAPSQESAYDAAPLSNGHAHHRSNGAADAANGRPEKPLVLPSLRVLFTAAQGAGPVGHPPPPFAHKHPTRRFS